MSGDALRASPRKEDIAARWQEYLDAEAEIMQQLELRGDRVH